VADSDFVVNLVIDLETTSAQQATQRFLNELRQGTTGLDKDINRIEKNLNGAGAAQQKFAQNLSTTRYALYDVSSTLAIAGGAMLGLAVATTAVAIAWERDFAQVVRTTGVTGDAIGKLRGELVDLAQTMPVAFGDLTQIATLAGQLGVAEQNVASFTATVAKFSAVTDLTVDAAATAFGRLDALLPDVQANYEALGSAIAKVGVNSVATESQIVSISTQISSMGAFAGLTAAEVIGLSGALASVGAQPELSRGTVTRLFTQMSRAIADGGDNLDKFAKVAGVSSDKFASSFGTNKFGPIFQSFVGGLADVTRNGGDATAALRDLGITSVRDVPLLLRLANASDSAGRAGALLAQTMKDANEGFGSGTELNRQYGIIAETTAARLQILVQNFQALMDAIGSANLGALGTIADGLSNFLGALTDLASTDYFGNIAGAVVVLVGLLGVLGLAAGAMALFGASSIGVTQALNGLVGAAPRAAAALLGSGTAAAIASGEMSAATASAKALGFALKALSLVGAILILPDVLGLIGDGLANLKYEAEGASKSTNAAFDRIISSVDVLATKLGDTEFTASITRALSGISSDTLLQDLKNVDEGLAALANNGNAEQAKIKFDELKAAWKAAGLDSAIFNQAFTDTNNALKEHKDVAKGAATEAEVLAAVEEQAAVAAENLATALGLVPDELKALQDGLASGSGAFFDFGDMIQRVQDKTRGWAEEQSEKVYDSKDSWQQFYDGASVNLQDFIVVLDGQIAAQQQWASDLGVLSAQGATAFVTELARMGPEGAPLAAAAVNATSEELMKLESQARLAAFLASDAFAQGFTENVPMLMEAYAQGGLEAVQALIDAQVSGAPGAVDQVISTYNLQLSSNPMRLQATDEDAVGETQRFMNYVNSQRPTVRIRATYETVGAPALPASPFYKQAAGGYITGPGTATSDSIPAYLSNGEYVIKAASVNKYGTAFMNALNSGRVPKFASGGSVGRAAPSGGAGSGTMELGPKTIKALAREAAVNVMIDDIAISRAAQSGNAKRRANGEL
jgi:TP901 family phage tail tape measure protein